MDATSVFSAAIARAIDEHKGEMKSALLIVYLRNKHRQHQGESCCFCMEHVNRSLNVAIRNGRMIEQEPVPYPHHVFIQYNWKQQPGIQDGTLTKWIGFHEAEVEAAQAVYDAMGEFDISDPVIHITSILKPYLA